MKIDNFIILRNIEISMPHNLSSQTNASGEAEAVKYIPKPISIHQTME